MLSEEDSLNVDETGHKDNGKRMWTWCFRASLFTLFKISPSRGSQVLLDVLGTEFSGTIGCDYFSAYRKYMRLKSTSASSHLSSSASEGITKLGESFSEARRTIPSFHHDSRRRADEQFGRQQSSKRGDSFCGDRPQNTLVLCVKALGSRSEAGQKWLERIWTVTATCAKTGHSVFEFLIDAVLANFQGQSAPSLAPDTS